MDVGILNIEGGFKMRVDEHNRLEVNGSLYTGKVVGSVISRSDEHPPTIFGAGGGWMPFSDLIVLKKRRIYG